MDRSVKITIGDKEYDLVLTLLAQKEVARKYGGLENLAEELDGDVALAEHRAVASEALTVDVELFVGNQGAAGVDDG